MKKMRKISKILKEDDLGDMGIGAMIIFIAVVLVAGIAASVLVQTANRLEIQAMTTGQETIREVSTGLAVIDIEGLNESGVIVNMTIAVRSRAGSGDIDLSRTIIELTDGTKKTLLTYDSDEYANITDELGDIFGNGTWTMDGEHFGILVIQDADNSLSAENPVINRGDIVMLCISTAAIFDTTGGLTPRSTIKGTVIPEQGSVATFSFRVPSSLTEAVYKLY
jgi:archaeal flagellin FlaB